MYATIRRYTPKDSSSAAKMFTGLKERVEKNFLPTLQDVQGFHGY